MNPNVTEGGVLFIRSEFDLPHARRPTGFSRCGADLAAAKKITEQQALAFLHDARCLTCFPGWNTRGLSR